MLVHGTPSWSYIWRNVARRLARKFQVYTHDLAGYGPSEQREGQDVRLRIHAKVLAELLAHWDLKKPHLVGHDFGGATVMGVHLVEGADVRSITVIDATLLNPWGTPYAQLVKANPAVFTALPSYVHLAIIESHLHTAINRRTDHTDVEPYLRPWSTPEGQRAYVRTFEQFDHDYTARLETLYPKLAVPVHIIWGENGQWESVSKARRVHDMIRESRFTLVSDGGHFLMEDAPGTVANAIEWVSHNWHLRCPKRRVRSRPCGNVKLDTISEAISRRGFDGRRWWIVENKPRPGLATPK